MSWMRAMGVLLAVSSLGFALLGALSVSDQDRFLARAVRTVGIVVPPSNPQRSDEPPVVSFRAVDGRSYRLADTGGIPRMIYESETDARVKLLYNQDNPTMAKVESWSALWMGAVLWFVAAAVSLLVGFLLIVKPNWGRRILHIAGAPVASFYDLVGWAFGLRKENVQTR